MHALPWVVIALAAGAAVWFGVVVVQLLRQIVEELRHIRHALQDVRTEFGKVSGPLNTVQKIYGLGENILRRGHDK
jgi:hypothetical protein